MFLLRTILLIPAVWSNVMTHEEMRLCPACIDHKYSSFFDKNAVVFPESYRNYGRREGLEKYRCMGNSYKLVQCDNACVRFHLVVTEQKKTKTVGWMFDCGTNVVQRVPITISNVPRDLRKFNGDFNFVDHLRTKGDILIYFDIQFYNDSRDVETAQQFYLRHYNEKKRKEDEERFPESPALYFIQKSLTKQNIDIGVGSFIMLVILAILIKFICSYKKPNLNKNDPDFVELLPVHREKIVVIRTIMS